jgi:transposase, IS30 family
VGRNRGDSGLSAAERLEMRRRAAAGERSADIAFAMARSMGSVQKVLRQSGGVPPRLSHRSALRLTLSEREEISRGLLARESLRAIARRLERAPSTIAREVARNGGSRPYRAWRAESSAISLARRPRSAKLAHNARLRGVVEHLLGLRWSPQQIAWRLRQDYPHEQEMWVSHETIYQSLFVQGRGALRAELTRCLRTGRTRRRTQGRYLGGEIPDMVTISERPAEIEDRAVPGHWEGDLIMGTANRSAIGTLVERQTRYLMLVRIPTPRTSVIVKDALAQQILTLPEQLRRSLTWDRGKEMGEHVAFSVATGVAVYFCDPHSPWQRGSNENTNGLLRQYFPKGTDLSVYDQAHLDTVAAELNGRPRQTLGWMKPSEAFARLVASVT